MSVQKVWNELGFWEYKCGCIQYQDGWDQCELHKGSRRPSPKKECFKVGKFDSDWNDEEGDVDNPSEHPERRVAKQRAIIEDEKNLPLPAMRMRRFASGATRHIDINKLDYEAFNNPLVDKVYGEYMHSHRIQADGEVREGDNWQKGWDKEVSIKSLIRHINDIRLHQRGYSKETTETLINSICASIFNLKALLLQVLRESGRA